MEGPTVALIAAQQVSEPSLTPNYTAVSASDTLSLGGQMMLHVKNAGGSADVVTVVVPGTGPGGIAIPDYTVSVPATTGDRMIPMVNPAYMDSTTSLVTVLHSFTTTVTQALIRI